MSNTILIADDSKLVVSLVRSIFEGIADQFKVVAAANGKDAIEKTLTEQPDIILMDWQMPEMTGLEALKVLKKNPKTAHIPVIMLTASESTTEVYELGASDFVQKPFNKMELIARVKTSLEAVNANKELKQRTIELEIQRDKLKLQKDLLVKQKKELAESADYAVKVQNLLMPYKFLSKNNIGEHFLFEIPLSDIPSHFFWIQKKDNLIFLCVGFHSKTGISSLLLTSAIVNELNNVLNSAKETNYQSNFLLLELQNALEKLSCSKNEKTHCTDLVFCILDPAKKTMQYAGVNVPIFVMKNEKLVELKTEKDALGFGSNELNFVNHKVQLANGDLIYILNDGFNEAKLGIMEEAFISDEILALFKKIYSKDLSKQKSLLEKAFENWRKDLKQVNDILAFGLKV